MTKRGALPNEQAAERVTNVAGWVCKTCRRFYGDEDGAERAARYCCEKDHACGNQGCANRAERPWIYCDACRAKKDEERWRALPEIDWDGETPLVVFDDDTFLHGPEDVDEYLEEHGLKVEDLRLVVCELERKPTFDISWLLEDYLPDGMDCDDPTKIEAVVGRWIERHVPDVWTAGKTRPSTASLRGSIETETTGA